jgi:predicted dehydrogenase
MQALEAGCHVLLEKPMVTSAPEAYALRDKVAETGKVFCLAYNTPCSPNLHYLREQVRNGGFGRLELVSGYLSQDWMRGTAGRWRQDPALSGGGQAYDSGAHLFCSLTWCVESPVERVFAFVDNHGAPVDINSVTAVRFENGVMASVTIGGNSPGAGSFAVFVFEKGRVEVDGWSAGWIKVFGPDGKPVDEPPIDGKPTQPADNFIDAILGAAEPRTSPEIGIVITELMDAIYESQRTGLPATPIRGA